MSILDNHHGKLSPSKRDRWSRCPMSVKLHIDGSSSEHAEDGTLTHKLLEHCIKNRVHPSTLDTDQERIERLTIAYEYVEKVTKGFDPSFTVETEKRISFFEVRKRWDLDGTIDILIKSPNRKEIIDYKDGLSFVDVKSSKQLKQYAAYISIYSDKEDVIVGTIIQPRNILKNKKPINSVTYDNEIVLISLADDLEYVDKFPEDINPGVIQCKYCSFAGKCAPLMNKCLEIFE